MHPLIAEHLKNIENQSDTLMKIPPGEQYIGNIQSVVSIALMEIKQCLEEIARLTTVEE